MPCEKVSMCTDCKLEREVAVLKAELAELRSQLSAKRGKFVPPTLDEIRAYCRERQNAVDAQAWLDHYTSNGWRVGRNPMLDWRAAVRTWERTQVTSRGVECKAPERELACPACQRVTMYYPGLQYCTCGERMAVRVQR